MAVLFGKHSRPERLRRVLRSPSMVESARGRPILLDGGRARHQLRHCAIAAGVINDKSSGFERQNNMCFSVCVAALLQFFRAQIARGLNLKPRLIFCSCCSKKMSNLSLFGRMLPEFCGHLHAPA